MNETNEESKKIRRPHNGVKYRISTNITRLRGEVAYKVEFKESGEKGTYVYVGGNRFKPDEIRQLVKDAKGEYPLNQFAVMCELDPPQIHNLMNPDKEIKRPLRPYIMGPLCENAYQYGEGEKKQVTLKKLLEANGFVALEADDESLTEEDKQILQQVRREIEEAKENTKRTIQMFKEESIRFEVMKNAVKDFLATERNLFLGVDKESSEESSFLRCETLTVIKLGIKSPVTWRFVFVVDAINDDSRSTDDSRSVKAARLSNYTFSRLNSRFLEDAWNPESFNQSRTSIVFFEKEVFDAFLAILDEKKAKTNNYFSCMLVDLEKKKVLEKKIATTKESIKHIVEL